MGLGVPLGGGRCHHLPAITNLCMQATLSDFPNIDYPSSPNGERSQNLLNKIKGGSLSARSAVTLCVQVDGDTGLSKKRDINTFLSP